MRDVWVGFTDPRVGVESDLLLATPRLPTSDHRGCLLLPPLAAVLLLTRGLCRAGLARSPACAPHDRRRPLADAHKRGPVSHTDVTSDTTSPLSVLLSECRDLAALSMARGPLRCVPPRLCPVAVCLPVCTPMRLRGVCWERRCPRPVCKATGSGRCPSSARARVLCPVAEGSCQDGRGSRRLDGHAGSSPSLPLW